MPFQLVWTAEAQRQYDEILSRAGDISPESQQKSSKQAGLAKQVNKTLALLQRNPRHPGLHAHPYNGYPNPYEPRKPVWEAYVQNKTPGAYRVFWCYGPDKGVITILTITPHP
ncbi:MAG TPA: hypothetical protein VM165_02065 [Planctomycetaceae bacterium]|nr:hypothetical protein [Planctomycetaceae bacterium]